MSEKEVETDLPAERRRSIQRYSVVFDADAIATVEPGDESKDSGLDVNGGSVELVGSAQDGGVIGSSSTDFKVHPSIESASDGLDETDADSENMFTDNPYLKRFCNAKWFLVFLCMYVIVQSMIVTGLFSATISTIEKRYGIRSSTMGLVASTYDFTVMCLVTFASFLGGKGHTPRWLAGGLLVLGFGGLVYSSPQWVSGKYEVDAISSAELCTLFNIVDAECNKESNHIVGIFFMAQVIIGTGATLLYTLGTSYLDNVVERSLLPVYLGIFYAVSALGPALGFIVGGLFLDEWVDPGNEPKGLTPEDPEWVGNWWGGFVLCGFMGIAMCIPLFLFPRYLPRTRHIRAFNKREADLVKRKLSITAGYTPHGDSFVGSARSLISNKVFVFNCLGQALEAFSVTGFSAFMPKAVQSIYGLSASTASFAVGGVIIPGAAGGIFFGGYLVKRLRLTPLATARLVWVVAIATLTVLFAFFIGCGTVSLAGVTSPYTGEPQTSFSGGYGGHVNISSPCNSDCTCDFDRYEPVCGADGLTYFSACHAGCTVEPSDGSYTTCGCVSTDGGTTFGASASVGKCDNGCDALVPFLFMLFLIMFFTFMNNVPATQVILRAVEPQHRSLAMGFQSLLFRGLGAIPGPIVFGAIIDRFCVFEETLCAGTDTTGSCWEYDNWGLRRSFVLLAVIPKLLSIATFFISWWFFRGVKGSNTAPDPSTHSEPLVSEQDRQDAANDNRRPQPPPTERLPLENVMVPTAPQSLSTPLSGPDSGAFPSSL